MGNENLKQWILKHRLENYGYDYKWFSKMSGHKAKLKKEIQSMSDAQIRKNLAKAGILGGGGRLRRVPTYKRITTKTGKTKLVKQGSKEWDYTTGQSFNEELLNIMQVGAGKKKNFFETQSGWWE